MEAFGAAIFAGREGRAGGVLEAAEAARAAPPGRGPRGRSTSSWTASPSASQSHTGRPCRRSRERCPAYAGTDGRDGDEVRWLWTSCPVTSEPLAPELWDDETWHELASRAVSLARDAGALPSFLPRLRSSACRRVRRSVGAGRGGRRDQRGNGERAAQVHLAGAPRVARSGGHSATCYRVEPPRRQGQGEGRAIGLAHYATAVLHNSLGRYQDALAAAQRACEHENFGSAHNV